MNGDAPRYLAEVVIPYDGDDCLIWPYYRNEHGYGMVSEGGRRKIVSRIVCGHRHGPPPLPRMDAAHSCGNGAGGCVAKRHLSWKTRTQNNADKLTHDTHTRGERSWNAKLTEDDIRRIRSMTGSQQSIAAVFGVSQTNISQIVRRVRWAHVR